MNENFLKNFKVNICRDHIGGLLGEAILKFFLKEKLIIKNENDLYDLTDKGLEDLELIGIDIEELRFSNNKLINICIEKENGILFEHIGSELGLLIYERFFELKWLKKFDDENVYLTKSGMEGLKSLGIRIKRYNFA